MCWPCWVLCSLWTVHTVPWTVLCIVQRAVAVPLAHSCLYCWQAGAARLLWQFAAITVIQQLISSVQPCQLGTGTAAAGEAGWTCVEQREGETSISWPIKFIDSGVILTIICRKGGICYDCWGILPGDTTGCYRLGYFHLHEVTIRLYSCMKVWLYCCTVVWCVFVSVAGWSATLSPSLALAYLTIKICKRGAIKA